MSLDSGAMSKSHAGRSGMVLGKRRPSAFQILLAKARCPPASEGFGIYEAWRNSPVRPPSGTGVALQRSASLPDHTTTADLAADAEWSFLVSPDDVPQAPGCGSSSSKDDCARVPSCAICNTGKFLEQNNDGTTTCGECGCVVEAVPFVAQTHDKQMRSDEDNTTRADDVRAEVRDESRSETASEARARHIREAGGTPISYKRGRSKGFGNAIGIVNRDAVRQHRQAIQWNAPLEGRIGQAFKQIQKTLDDVEGLDEKVARECRTSLRRVLELDEKHSATCKAASCEVCVVGAGLQVVAGCVVTVVAEHLLRHLDKPSWPLAGVKVARATLLQLSDAPWRTNRASTVTLATTKLSVERLLYGTAPPTHCQPLTSSQPEKCLSEESLCDMDNDRFSAVRNSLWAFVRLTAPPAHLREAMFESLGTEAVSQWASTAETTPDILALALALAVARKIQISSYEQHFTSKLKQVVLQQMASLSAAYQLTETVFALLPAELGLESPAPAPAGEVDELL